MIRLMTDHLEVILVATPLNGRVMISMTGFTSSTLSRDSNRNRKFRTNEPVMKSSNNIFRPKKFDRSNKTAASLADRLSGKARNFRITCPDPMRPDFPGQEIRDASSGGASCATSCRPQIWAWTRATGASRITWSRPILRLETSEPLDQGLEKLSLGLVCSVGESQQCLACPSNRLRSG